MGKLNGRGQIGAQFLKGS